MQISAAATNNFFSFTVSCTLDKTKVLTFDGLEYPIDEMQCPHVLMISPKRLEREWSIASYLTPKQANVAVLAKDLDNGQRQLIIVIDGEMHTLEISNSNRQIILDGRPVNFRGDSGLISGLLGENLNILELPFSVYKISIKSVGVYIYFNGQRVQLEVSKKLHIALCATAAKCNQRQYYCVLGGRQVQRTRTWCVR